MSVKTGVLIQTDTVNDEEVTLVEWLVGDGCEVQKNDRIAIIETSKTNFEITADQHGFLAHKYKAGDDVLVGSAIGYISPGENKKNVGSNIKDFVGDVKKMLESSPVHFSRKAKVLIADNNLDPTIFYNLPLVKGSDVMAYLHTGSHKEEGQVAPQQPLDSSIGKNISRDGLEQDSANVVESRISRAKRTEIKNLRSGQDNSIKSFISSILVLNGESHIQYASQYSQLSVVIFEVSRLLLKYPEFMTYYNNGVFKRYVDVNIAFAVDAGFGLKTLVIQNADKKTYLEIKLEQERLVEKYLDDSLETKDFLGASFTISDLSEQDVFCFDPLLSDNQAAILGISSFTEVPVANVSLGTFTLSFDHQVTEGKKASEFLAELKGRFLAHIQASQSKLAEIYCGSCHKSFTELQQLKAKMLSHYVTTSKLEPICSLCINGW